MLGGTALFEEIVHEQLDFSSASNESDVAYLLVQGGFQCLLIVSMSPRDNQNETVGGKIEIIQALIVRPGHCHFCCGEALLGQEALSIVDDADTKVDPGRNPADRLAYVTRPQNDQSRSGRDGLHEDFHPTAANQPVILQLVVGHLVLEELGPARFHHLRSRLPHLGFDASSTNRPDRGPILANEHLGGIFAGGTAGASNDGRQRGRLSQPAEANDFFEKIRLLLRHAGY